MNKFVKWGGVAFIGWWIVTAPASAGHEVGNLGHLATHAATSVSTLISSV